MSSPTCCGIGTIQRFGLPMAFDGTTLAQDGVRAARPAIGGRLSVTVDRLPFVGERGDGQKSFWRMPGLGDGESARLRAMTYAAWFLVYAELNGPAAGKWLLDRIEREMPSRYPNVDRIFLDEVLSRR